MRSRENSCGEHEREALAELATVLACGFLRLPENARNIAVSDAENPRNRLAVSQTSRPDVTDNEAA